MAMKILLPIDGSKLSARVAQAAAHLARELAQPPTLVLLHADVPLMRQVATALGARATHDYHESNSAHAMRGARAVLRRAKLAFEETMLVGDPAASIVKTAQAGKFDLVIMGSQGRGALKAALLGSVAVKVLSQCAVPVMVVR